MSPHDDPEELARRNIDASLEAAGWSVQDYKAKRPPFRLDTDIVDRFVVVGPVKSVENGESGG